MRHAITEGTRAYVEMLASLVPGRSKDAKRERALASFAGMVGAIVLARAVDDAALSKEILQAAAKSISGPGTLSK